MSINIESFDEMIGPAVKHFWRSRTNAARNQEERGISDQGNRSSVTAGKNLDGFTRMIKQIIIDNGINERHIYHTGRVNITIPGFFRPTKSWDLLVVRDDKLLAGIEFKSMVGPSFGNNFNNRVEEALGNSADLRTAFREQAFGESLRPFLGYFFVLEECEKSLSPVSFSSPHFRVFPEFNDTSYAKRFEIFCRKLIQEGFYDCASLILTKKDSIDTGRCRSLSEITSPEVFVRALASRMAGNIEISQ